MKYEKRIVDPSRGIQQITYEDERWYTAEKDGQEVHIPSVTWICGFYPKGIEFYKWLANKGWDESQALKTAAGDKGSKIHHAIEALILGQDVDYNSMYMNHTTKQDEELSSEEFEAVWAFQKWFEKMKPEVIEAETVTMSEKYGFAGTVDFICKIGDQTYIVDFKTGQYIWTEYELQVSAYKHSLIEEKKVDENVKLAILQVGYRKNKMGYKFTEIEDKFKLFLGAKMIWSEEAGKQKPLQKDLPIKLSLNLQKQDVTPKTN